MEEEMEFVNERAVKWKRLFEERKEDSAKWLISCIVNAGKSDSL
jgi:hypothetical protein